MNNLSQVLQNPKTMVLRKFMAQILEDKVDNYEDILIRIGCVLVTEGDLKSFGLMINDVLEAGHQNAVKSYKKQLGDMGFEIIP